MTPNNKMDETRIETEWQKQNNHFIRRLNKCISTFFNVCYGIDDDDNNDDRNSSQMMQMNPNKRPLIYCHNMTKRKVTTASSRCANDPNFDTFNL